MAGLLSPMRYAQVVYLTAPAAPSSPAPPRRCRSGSRPGHHSGLPEYAFTRSRHDEHWFLIKLTVFLWLIRKTAKLTGWFLLAAIAIAA